MRFTIPAITLTGVLQHWSGVQQLVSAYWYERQLAQYADHWLVQLEEALDLGPLAAACAGYHQGSGKGSAVIHSVPKLARGLLVKYLYDYSYRQTEEQVDCHMLLKWFVGYSLFEPVFDHSTLCRFELWVLKHHPRFFFDEILTQIDAAFPAEQQQQQLVDTFAMLARGAKTSLITLLRHLSGQLLADLEKIDPQRFETLSQLIDREALFGVEGEKITPALNVAEREARLQQIARQVWRLYHGLSYSLDQEPLLPADRQAPLREGLSYLDKIMADEVALTLIEPQAKPVPQPDQPVESQGPATAPSPAAEAGPAPLDLDQSERMTVRELKNKDKGSYRIVSYNDLEATYRKHSADEEASLGYNAAVLTSRHFVRETEVVTGSTPDPDPLPGMLRSQYQQHGFWPEKVIGDTIFGPGKVRAQVAQVSDGQTQLVALLMPYDKRSDKYHPLRFTLSDDGQSLTCPHDVTTTKRGQYEGRGGYDFTYTAQMCRDCPFFTDCRGEDGNPKARRKVFISFYLGQVQAALDYNRTDRFKLEIKQRPRVERVIYNLTNLHGARRCHSVGLEKANFQLKMAATAFNIRQFIRLKGRFKAPPQPLSQETSAS